MGVAFVRRYGRSFAVGERGGEEKGGEGREIEIVVCKIGFRVYPNPIRNSLDRVWILSLR